MPIERMIPADDVIGIASNVASTKDNKLKFNLRFIVSFARSSFVGRHLPRAGFVNERACSGETSVRLFGTQVARLIA